MKKFLWMALVASLVPAASSWAQDPEDPGKARGPVTQLKVQVVLSRHQGDRKVSSRPYTFWLTSAVRPRQFRLRQGTEVPIPVTTYEKDGKDATSFQYKNVGVNMEFSAEVADGGRYLLTFAVEDSSMFDGAAGPNVAVSPTLKVPAFNTHVVQGTVLLRDGETLPFSNTQSVTGDVAKVEITLNVVK
jgi:hypothetical protein